MSQPAAPRPGPFASQSMPRGAVNKHGSVLVTHGVRVAVSPSYLPHDSDPKGDVGRPRWVFAYRVRITNESEHRAHLLTRHWTIVDADGERHEVHGEGVVGHQPDLGPGEHFEYSSYCPLETPWGTMQGEFQFEGADGARFAVPVARFFLVSKD